MFKPDLWQSHNEYRTLVNTYGRRLSRNNPIYSFDLYDRERQKLLNLNLDAIRKYIMPFYSPGGRPAKKQAQILRSLILFVLHSERTACERVNDRVLNDYCLQHLKIRGKDHFSFRAMLIGICIHLDARYKAAHLYTA